MATVHISPFSGTWYPGRPAELRALLDRLFASSLGRTGPCLLSHPAGFVVPHAGLSYSGAVASAAYRHIQDHPPACIVVLGFSHRGGPHGVAVPDVWEFSTPLGPVPLDRAIMERLTLRKPFRLVPENRVCDHSVEIQLPLLQYAAPGVPVVPLYVGVLEEPERQAAAQALAALAFEGALVLASSDFTHYGAEFAFQPFPVGELTAGRLRALDFGAAEAAGSLDASLFEAYLAKTGATVCGAAPVALWLSTVRLLAGQEIFQTVLDYQTSGEILDDYRQSVSYAALGYFPASSFELSAQDRGLLLTSAHATLAQLRQTRKPVPVPPVRITPSLTRKAAVFVSLHRGQELLGCVGMHTGHKPLAEAVPEMTLAAALDDPRFSGILEVEGQIQVEISVLSPTKRVRGPAALQVGWHGAWLRLGARAALLLPQVAAGHDWTAESFLQALARKAGLGPDDFRHPEAELALFRAQVFS